MQFIAVAKNVIKILINHKDLSNSLAATCIKHI